jgi:hypothetical protein
VGRCISQVGVLAKPRELDDSSSSFVATPPSPPAPPYLFSCFILPSTAIPSRLTPPLHCCHPHPSRPCTAAAQAPGGGASKLHANGDGCSRRGGAGEWRRSQRHGRHAGEAAAIEDLRNWKGHRGRETVGLQTCKPISPTDCEPWV